MSQTEQRERGWGLQQYRQTTEPRHASFKAGPGAPATSHVFKKVLAQEARSAYRVENNLSPNRVIFLIIQFARMGVRSVPTCYLTLPIRHSSIRAFANPTHTTAHNSACAFAVLIKWHAARGGIEHPGLLLSNTRTRTALRKGLHAALRPGLCLW